MLRRDRPVMHAPSMTSDAEMPQLTSPSPSTAEEPPPRVRRSPRASLGGWLWVGINRQAGPKKGSQTETPRLTGRSRAGSRRLQRGARTILIWGLLWYLLLHPVPLLILHCTTEYPWQPIDVAIEARKWPRLRQLVDEAPERPLVVMLGSSRACWAFRAGDLDGMPDSDGQPLRVYNLGVAGTGPIYELFCLRDLLAKGFHPRFLLIELNPTLFCELQPGSHNEVDMLNLECLSARRFLQWFPYFSRPQEKACQWLGTRLAPWYAFRRSFQLEAKYLTQGIPCPCWEGVDDWGWHIPITETWPIGERVGRLTFQYFAFYGELSQFRVGEKQTQAFRELLELCRRENIPAALVLMPESSHFRSWYSSQGRTAIRGLLDELNRTYHVKTIDANCWLDDDDFEDGHHALRHGAEVFTSRLRAELPRLLAQSKAANSD
jgi:hypothetical protein